MIRSTFSFIPGIGEKSEELLWRKGISTWNDLKRAKYLSASNGTRAKIIQDYIQKAEKALKNINASFFAEHLPQKEHWRLYRDFLGKTVFLDIETTGLSLYYDVITLIGTFDGRNYRVFIKDNNLTEIVDHLKGYDIVVTFNGKLFDVPFIKKQFPSAQIPSVHIDLRFLLKSLGFSGPLKETEKRLDIKRTKEVQRIDGREAAVLWSRFVKGDNDSLRRLILYNICDTANLKSIMDFCYKKKIENEIVASLKHGSTQTELFHARRKKAIDFNLPFFDFNMPQVTIRRYRDQLTIKGDNKRLIILRRDRIKRAKLKINTLIRTIKKPVGIPVVVGIDLTGSEERASGFCILQGKEAYLSTVKTDREIIEKTIQAKPALVSIDSPLGLPKGRCCTEDSCECRRFGIMRECERNLKKRGVNVYPCLIKSMQKLTLRGMNLKSKFKRRKLEVIESYPGAAQDILRFPRKRINLRELEIDLMNMGIKPLSENETITHDEIDALTSALVGYFYLARMYEAIGNTREGFLIIPELNQSEAVHAKA